jgi:hypothetical protein
VIRHCEEAENKKGSRLTAGETLAATREEAHQVGRPIFFAMAIIILAFLPVFALTGQEGKLVHRATVHHSYPHCWRCETPLIYRAISTWFVKVEAIKDRLVHNNSLTYWVPDFVKEKRFHNWLAGARDWAISRNRFWGTPLPIWRSDDGGGRLAPHATPRQEAKGGGMRRAGVPGYGTAVVLPSSPTVSRARTFPRASNGLSWCSMPPRRLIPSG